MRPPVEYKCTKTVTYTIIKQTGAVMLPNGIPATNADIYKPPFIQVNVPTTTVGK